MHKENLKLTRLSFRPSYGPGSHPYRKTTVQNFLDNTPEDWIIIVDANHIVSPGPTSAAKALANWASIKSRLQTVLRDFPNNPRVAVELFNELYITHAKYYDLVQDLVTWIRNDLGYSNTLVCNKLTWSGGGRNYWEKS